MRNAYYEYRMNETNVANGASDLMTIREVSIRLNICKVTIYKMVKRGEISYKQFGSKILIDRKDVEDFIRRNTHPAHAPFMEGK